MAVLALVPMKNQQSNLGYLFAMEKMFFYHRKFIMLKQNCNELCD